MTPSPSADGALAEAAAATSAVRRAAAALREGAMVVVVDEADREDEADLVLDAGTVSAEQMAFVVRHTTGILCAPMPGGVADRLWLPPMVQDNADNHGTAFTVSVDHAGSGTGVAAADRARTFRALADPGTAPEDLRRPGHVFPLRARDGGVLVRPGHTEAAVDLLALAGRGPVAVISELVAEDGGMLRGPAVADFAAEHGLAVVAVADLVRHRRRTERLVEPIAESRMPTRHGVFRATAFRSTLDGTEHLALTLGDVATDSERARGVLTRVHSECLTGDVLGSLRCDCGAQLDQALEAIAAEGAGVVVYLRGHEGRGIGLAHKIRAYALQEGGLDTVDANIAQGLPVDARSYDAGAQILAQLGIRRVRLITNNPSKYDELAGYGVEIGERVVLPTLVTPENVRYLRTKRARLGHELDDVLADRGS